MAQPIALLHKLLAQQYPRQWLDTATALKHSEKEDVQPLHPKPRCML